MSGSQRRYTVFASEQLVACLSFDASAWKLKDRERFIGWSEAQRSRNLHLVANNARFLILPRVRSLGLASKILSKVARLLPKDWMARYGFAPVLLETFVEFERHKGRCYRAANWTLVGRTAGRGKKSKSNKPLIPIKAIWLNHCAGTGEESCVASTALYPQLFHPELSKPRAKPMHNICRLV